MSDHKVLDDRKYTEEHEWIKIEGDLAVIGITDYAQDQLGDVTYVDLPEVDDEIDQGAELGVIESVKTAADVYAPAAGTVVEVNDKLEDEPELLNQDCYGAGWLVKMSGCDQGVLDDLMDAAAYTEFVGNEEE